MKVCFSLYNNYNSIYQPTSLPRKNNYNVDSVHFGAMKKNEFKTFDLSCVEKFRAPIEKFKSNDDLQAWASLRIEKLIKQSYPARTKEATFQRNSILQEWIKYVTKENGALNPAMQLIILYSIVKDLSPKAENCPPVLNKRVLADTLCEIEEILGSNPKSNFDFLKIYSNNLKKHYIPQQEGVENEHLTQWIVIPSLMQDAQNYDSNVEKLKTLSHDKWCTKTFNAKDYLSSGEFHIYFENGEPQLGLRFWHEKIYEIQGSKNDGKVPIKYLGLLENYIAENDIDLIIDAEVQISDAQTLKNVYKRFKDGLALIDNEPESIFNYFNIQTQKDENNLLTLSKLINPHPLITFDDLGIDTNALIRNAKIINGYVNTEGYKDFPELTQINGYAYIRPATRSVPKLKEVNGGLCVKGMQELPSLEYVQENLSIENDKIMSLPNLKFVGKNIDLNCKNLKEFPDLKVVRGDLKLQSVAFADFGSLESIEGNLIIDTSEIENPLALKNIKNLSVEKNIILTGDSHLRKSDFKNVKVGGKIYDLEHNLFDKLKKRLLGIM